MPQRELASSLMTTRQPRRPRRRTADTATLPRQADGTPAAARAARAPVPRHHREHHVTNDYSYVRKDLVLVGVVGVVVLAFIVAMSFIIS